MAATVAHSLIWPPCALLPSPPAAAYGTPPVVHAVGGLADTVQPFNPFENSGTGEALGGTAQSRGRWRQRGLVQAPVPTQRLRAHSRQPTPCAGRPSSHRTAGWTFEGGDAAAFRTALNYALTTYRQHPESFRDIQLRGMEQDLSWGAAAAQVRLRCDRPVGRITQPAALPVPPVFAGAAGQMLGCAPLHPPPHPPPASSCFPTCAVRVGAACSQVPVVTAARAVLMAAGDQAAT